MRRLSGNNSEIFLDLNKNTKNVSIHDDFVSLGVKNNGIVQQVATKSDNNNSSDNDLIKFLFCTQSNSRERDEYKSNINARYIKAGGQQTPTCNVMWLASQA